MSMIINFLTSLIIAIYIFIAIEVIRGFIKDGEDILLSIIFGLFWPVFYLIGKIFEQ